MITLLLAFITTVFPLFLQAQNYKILPLGNSITEGKVANPGYRYPLYEQLRDAYIDFTFIGSLTENYIWNTDVRSCIDEPRVIPPLAYEGHGGWRADQILSGKPNSDPGKLSIWLQDYTPDVVLMHLGSNDMFQFQSVSSTIGELREIVRVLRQDNPAVIILMAKLIPAHAPTVGEKKANNIILLNNEIPSLVQELNTAQSPVILVDQQTGFDPAVDTFDGIHTSKSGSIKMANKWFQALSKILNRYTQPPNISISNPLNGAELSAGRAVNFSATATDPEGALRRVEFFVNCTKIGEDSTSPFEISWTPAKAGEYVLEAKAIDAAGAQAISEPVWVSVAENTDVATELPVLHRPQQNSSSSRNIGVDFSLPEAAKAGTVKLTFTRTGGATDGFAPHVLVFAPALEVAGRHTLTLSGSSLGSHNQVASVSSSPNDALVSGATYSVTISYQDENGNAAASVTHTEFRYDYDISPPATPDKPLLAGSSDTGTSNADGITSIATPKFYGTAEANSLVTIYLNEAVLATTTADAGGKWSYTVSAANALADGHYQIKVTSSDAAGNKSAASEALLMVVDRAAPVVLVKDITLELGSTGKATVSVASVNAGSSDNVTAANALVFSLSRTNFSCDDLGKIQDVTLRATDEAGNTATAVSKISVTDKLAPSLSVQDVNLQLNSDGKATLTETAVVVAKSDNCSTASISMSRTDFSCADAGKLFSITVTATDAVGNKTEKVIKVAVEDRIAPVAMASNITVALAANGIATITAADIDNGSSDNCDTISFALSKSSFGCADVGDNEVVLRVKDAFGNSATATATVTVEDKRAPQFTVQDISLPLNQDGVATLTEAAAITTKSDNCSTPAINFSRTDFGCADVGKSITVTATAKDAAGNMSQKNLAVTVTDVTAPVVKTKNITVQLGSNGQANITVAAIDRGSSDNCSLADLSLDKTVFSCTDLGSNTVKLTARDGAGNTASATASVTVVDPLAPAIAAGQVFEIDENSPAGTAVGSVSATDNCSTASWQIIKGNNANAFAISAGGQLSVNKASALDYEKDQQFILELRVKDRDNNTASGTVTIKLKDLNDNAPELAKLADVSAKEHELINFSASASDADGNSELQYSLEGEVPVGASINKTTALFSWKPAEDQDGVYKFAVLVSDGLFTAKQPVTITVQEVNQEPFITSVPVVTAMAGEVYTYQIVATDADLPANRLSFSAVAISRWLKFDATTGVLSGTPGIGDEGEHAITLRVADGMGAIIQQFTIVVERPTGIEDGTNKEETGVVIFPNPSTGSITISIDDFPAGKDIEACLLSLEGKQLFCAKGSLQQISEQVSGYLGNSTAGVYVLQLVQDEQLSTHKIVKQ